MSGNWGANAPRLRGDPWAALQEIVRLHADSRFADVWVCTECGRPEPCPTRVTATDALAAGDPS